MARQREGTLHDDLMVVARAGSQEVRWLSWRSRGRSTNRSVRPWDVDRSVVPHSAALAGVPRGGPGPRRARTGHGAVPARAPHGIRRDRGGRLGAECAVVLVHSFAPEDTTNFEAFSAFVRLLGVAEPRKEAVLGPGWARCPSVSTRRASPRGSHVLRLGLRHPTSTEWANDANRARGRGSELRCYGDSWRGGVARPWEE